MAGSARRRMPECRHGFGGQSASPQSFWAPAPSWRSECWPHCRPGRLGAPRGCLRLTPSHPLSPRLPVPALLWPASLPPRAAPYRPPRPPLQHPRVSSPLPCAPFHLLPALPSLHPPGAPPGGLSLDTCPGTGEVVSGRCVCPCLPARCPPPSKSSPHLGLRPLGSMSGRGCEGSARRAV